MTCREKLEMEHPEYVRNDYVGGSNKCPHNFGYAKQPKWCRTYFGSCKDCWDREVETDMSIIKDSGDRTEFETGAVRDMHEGKGRCDLLPACVLLRLARHYENGARKYGDRNWQKGIPCHSFADSAMRHMLKYLDGQTDEDHLIAAIWNLCGLAWTEEKMPEMMDIPERMGK